MANHTLSLLLSAGVLASGLAGQTQPAGYFSTACIKVNHGKAAEYRQFVTDYSRKLAQVRADAGSIAGYMLLRSVMPAGEDARCDFIAVTRYKGAPTAPAGPEGLEQSLRKAGLNMTAAAFAAKRDALTHLVSMEMWRSQIRVAEAQKGDYLYVNLMKVHDMSNYAKFEKEVWQPMAEAWVKDGAMRAWGFSTAFLPSGTERKYAAASVDVFPSWEALFTPLPFDETFKKIHPSKQQEQTMTGLTKLRDLARRELYVVQEKIGPSTTTISQR